MVIELYMKINTVTRISEEVPETSLQGFPKSINKIADVKEAYIDFA